MTTEQTTTTESTTPPTIGSIRAIRARHVRLLQEKSGELLDVMLDIAAEEVADFPEDVESVEAVRSYLHASLASEPVGRVPTRELLLVFGVLIDTLGIDCGSAALRADIEREIAELLDPPALDPRHAFAAPPVPRHCPCCAELAIPLYTGALQ